MRRWWGEGERREDEKGIYIPADVSAPNARKQLSAFQFFRRFSPFHSGTFGDPRGLIFVRWTTLTLLTRQDTSILCCERRPGTSCKNPSSQFLA